MSGTTTEDVREKGVKRKAEDGPDVQQDKIRRIIEDTREKMKKFPRPPSNLVMIPEDEELDKAEEVYKRLCDKIVPFIEKTDAEGNVTRYHVNCEIPKDKPRSVGYLYSGASAKKISAGRFEDQTCLTTYGYHTYGGFYGIFRPDIVEVMWLLLQEFQEHTLDACDAIYCTTEAYPSLDVRSCYDSVVDRHKAVTRCYLVVNDSKC